MAGADRDDGKSLGRQIESVDDFEDRAVAADRDATVISLGSLGEFAGMAGPAGEGTAGADVLTQLFSKPVGVGAIAAALSSRVEDCEPRHSSVLRHNAYRVNMATSCSAWPKW